MAELEGKVAVITGAGSGMGRAATQVFVREGARVLAADISGGQDDTAAALGDAVSAFQVDVTQEDSVEAMFAAAVEQFGRSMPSSTSPASGRTRRWPRPPSRTTSGSWP